MSIGKGIAIAAVWVSVTVMSFNVGPILFFIGLFAVLATAIIAAV